MWVGDDDICALTESVWSWMLGARLERAPGHQGPAAPEAMTGWIRFTGAWEGIVLLQCTRSLARRAASATFGVALSQVREDDGRDVLGELTNMIAGHIKSLLPISTQISLPTVADGLEGPTLPEEVEICGDVSLRCDGEPLRVQVLKKVSHFQDDGKF